MTGHRIGAALVALLGLLFTIFAPAILKFFNDRSEFNPMAVDPKSKALIVNACLFRVFGLLIMGVAVAIAIKG